MKRTLLAILALLLAALLAVPALAENAVVNTIELTNCYAYVNGPTGILVVQDGNTDTCVLMDSYGKILTPKSYADMMSAGNGVFEVKSNDGVNSCGVIDSNGVEVVPLQYGKTIVLNARWQIGAYLVEATADDFDYQLYDKTCYQAERYDIYYRGALVGTLARADYDSAEAYGDYLYVKSRDGRLTFYNKDLVPSGYQSEYFSGEYDISYDGGRALYWHKGSNQRAFVKGCTLTEDEVETSFALSDDSYYDLQGNLLFTLADPDWAIPDYQGEYARVFGDGKYGLIDKQGNVIVPCEYDSIDCDDAYLGAGYQMAVKDGKVGFFDANGKETCPFTYSAANAFTTTSSPFAALRDPSGSIIVLSGAVGELPERYSDIQLPNDNACPVFVAQNADGQVGVIDLKGNALIPFDSACPSVDDVSISNDGTVVAIRDAYRNCTVYTLSFDPPQPGDAPEAEVAEPGAPAADAGEIADKDALIAQQQAQIDALTAELDAAQARIAALESASADENP